MNKPDYINLLAAVVGFAWVITDVIICYLYHPTASIIFSIVVTLICSTINFIFFLKRR